MVVFIMRIYQWIVLSLLILLNPAFAEINICNKPVDGTSVAIYETNMWKAYYAKDYMALFSSLFSFTYEQFDLSLMDTQIIAFHAAKAARIFSTIPQEAPSTRYNTQVLPSLIASFSHLKKVVKGNWDAQEVARAELHWWVMRRTQDKDDVAKVGRQIARVYVLLYGADNADIQRAGYLRAKAAWLRDQQARQGKIKWGEIQRLLQKAYTTLFLGIGKICEGMGMPVIVYF